MDFSVLREVKGCEIWDEVEETRMTEEQKEKGQHAQDMSCKVAGALQRATMITDVYGRRKEVNRNLEWSRKHSGLA